MTGPYTDPNLEAPWLCQLSIGGSIDPCPFTDVDGQLYLLWKNDGNCCGNPVHIWAQPLQANGVEFVNGTEAVELITNDLPWEGNLVEAPSMIVRVDSATTIPIYYLFYSCNSYASYQYAVGYAECKTPLGPCQKVNLSPIIGYYGSAWGPGGEQPFYDVHGDLWFCYHSWTAPNGTFKCYRYNLYVKS